MVPVTTVLIFARSVGFTLKAPGLSHPSTPKMVHLICAASMALALSGSVPSSPVNLGIPLLLAFIVEVMIGAALGTLSAVLYDGAYAAGRVLDDYLGIRSAMPTANVASGAEFGRLWSNAFLAGLLLSGGFERLIVLFAQTFQALPPGLLPAHSQIVAYALVVPILVVQAALMLVAPAMATVLLAQISLGVASRIVPRLSTFTLSFPLVYAVALGVTFAAVPRFLPLAAHPWFAMPFHAHG